MTATRCKLCGDTGVDETGNNDLPCDCPAGDTALFRVCGRGTITGAEVRKTYNVPPPPNESNPTTEER